MGMARHNIWIIKKNGSLLRLDFLKLDANLVLLLGSTVNSKVFSRS